MTQALARPLRALEDNALLVALVAFVAVLATAVLAPALIVADTWLALVAGREVVESGLPREDTLTVLGSGATWTDQQWLAQVVLYGLERLGGLALVSLVAAACVTSSYGLALAAARWRGASARSTLVVAVVALFAAPWSWQARAQALALPLFVGVLWLLADARAGVRSRTLLVLPLLVVWANVHGSVVLGAGLAMLLAAVCLVRRQGDLRLAAALVVLAPLAVLVTPYSPLDTLDYYRLVLVDPPFAGVVVEWEWSEPAWRTAVFYAVAAGWLVLAVWQRRRLALFEHLVLALTFLGAVWAIRGIAWFALAAIVLLPVALDGAWPPRPTPVRRGVNRVVVAVSGVAVVACAVSLLARGSEWLEKEWPDGAVAAVEQATRDPGTRVYSRDRFADWLLWRIPELHGRLAYDVRFELLERDEIESIVRWNGEQGEDWLSIADGFDVVVLDPTDVPSHRDDLLAEPGARTVYRDAVVEVIARG